MSEKKMAVKLPGNKNGCNLWFFFAIIRTLEHPLLYDIFECCGNGNDKKFLTVLFEF